MGNKIQISLRIGRPTRGAPIKASSRFTGSSLSRKDSLLPGRSIRTRNSLSAPTGKYPSRLTGRRKERGPRKSWTARHKILTIIGGTFGVFIVMGAIGAIAGAGKQPSPAPAAAATPAVPSTVTTHSPKATRAAATHPAVRAKTSSKPKARTGSAETACDARGFASGDIYVRWEDPGVP